MAATTRGISSVNIGRTRSNAISGPDQRPSMQHVSKLPEPVQEKTLEERQAISATQMGAWAIEAAIKDAAWR